MNNKYIIYTILIISILVIGILYYFYEPKEIKQECEYTLSYKDEDYCILKEVKEYIGKLQQGCIEDRLKSKRGVIKN